MNRRKGGCAMRKILSAALALCLLIAVCSGCASRNEAPADAAAPAETSAPPAQAAAEAPDPEASAFASAEVLAAGVRQARETAVGDRTEAQAVLAALDEVYAPDAEFDGFELLGVEAMEGFLIYYYMPADGPAYDGFDYRRGISVTVCTDPAVTLEQVCGELGLTVGPDGFAPDTEHSQLFFEQEGRACSLQMPEGADPETMKAFCKIKRFPVN